METGVLPRTEEVKYIIDWMLKGRMRNFVIDKIKAPFHKVIILVAKRLPEITKENTLHPNTHILIELRDKFFQYDTNTDRKALFKAAWKMFIAEYEHDPYYRYRFDWLIEEIANSNWKVRPIGNPIGFWEEPKPYGGGYLIKDETLKKNINRFRNIQAMSIQNNLKEEK